MPITHEAEAEPCDRPLRAASAGTRQGPPSAPETEGHGGARKVPQMMPGSVTVGIGAQNNRPFASLRHAAEARMPDIPAGPDADRAGAR